MAGLILSGMLAVVAVALCRILNRVLAGIDNYHEGDAKRAGAVASLNAQMAEQGRQFDAPARPPAR